MIGRPRTCNCNECNKCKNANTARERWQALTLDERRAVIARRDKEKVALGEAVRYLRHKEKRTALNKEWYENNREQANESKKKWAQENPDKRLAQQIANNAVRDGQLAKKECEVGIGCNGRIEKHHDDYSKPLDVRWLCTKHHGETRRKRLVTVQ